MFRYLRALWYLVTGRFAKATAALQSNEYVMAATYDQAIHKGQDRFTTVRNAVAQIMALENTRVQEIKELNQQHERLTKIKAGAQVAMQRRIDALLGQGMAKEQIKVDPEFIKHEAAFKDATSTLEQVSLRIKEKEADLEEKKKQVATYKVELQNMQRAQESLREEKQSTIADVAIAKQAQAINDALTGIEEDTTDQDLAEVRRQRDIVKQKAKISADLAGNDARNAESEYLQMSESTASDKELDSLLNWGDSKDASKLEDAKVPE